MKKNRPLTLVVSYFFLVLLIASVHGCLSQQTLRIQVLNKGNIPEQGAIVFVSDGSVISLHSLFGIYYAKIRELWSNESAQQWGNRKNIPAIKIAFTDEDGVANVKIYRAPLFIHAISSNYSYYWSTFENAHLFRQNVNVVLPFTRCEFITSEEIDCGEFLLEKALIRNENQKPEVYDFLQGYRKYHGQEVTNVESSIMSIMDK